MAWADVADLFAVQVPVWELVLRGSAMYWFLFVIFRFVLHRDVGSLGLADVLLLVIIADASQNAMAGEYKTLSEGFILVATIVGWNYLLDWAAFRFEPVRRFAEPPPLMLIAKGRVLRANLRKEMMTLDELMAQLRAKNIEHVSQVKAAYMESDGQVTVIEYKAKARAMAWHTLPSMTLAPVSFAQAPHPERRASSLVTRSPQGCIVEFLDLRTSTDATLAGVWVHTLNLRPVPGVEDAALQALFDKRAASDFRLHQLTRPQRQLHDLLEAWQAEGDADDLPRIARQAQAKALAEFAQGSALSALYWHVGEHLAQHRVRLDDTAGERVWAQLEARGREAALPLAQLDLPDDAQRAITGANAAQERALAGRADAIARLKAVWAKALPSGN